MPITWKKKCSYGNSIFTDHLDCTKYAPIEFEWCWKPAPSLSRDSEWLAWHMHFICHTFCTHNSTGTPSLECERCLYNLCIDIVFLFCVALVIGVCMKNYYWYMASKRREKSYQRCLSVHSGAFRSDFSSSLLYSNTSYIWYSEQHWNKTMLNFSEFFLVFYTTNRGIVNRFNSPSPSCLKPLFQSEAKCEAIDLKMIFNFHAHKTHFPNKGFEKLEFNSERYIVINTRLIFGGWGTCDITGTLKMHICKWSGSAKTPCYAPINVKPAGGRQGMGWGFDCLCWPWGREG